MKKYLILFFILIFFRTQGQIVYSFKELLGDYNIGYFDTVVTSNIEYKYNKYQSNAPLFIKIWHPIPQNNFNKSNFLSFNEIYNINSSIYKFITDTINRYNNLNFIEYNIAYTFPDYKNIKYRNSSNEQIFESILNFKTNSTYISSNLKQKQFPIIYYLHGSLGNAAENFIMAEYFASRGYIFISCSMHLPFDNIIFGINEINFDFSNYLNTLFHFGEKISNNNKQYIIAHSWGAQLALLLLKNNSNIDGLISLETTLEYPKDSAIYKDRWPELYQLLVKEKFRYSIPIMFLAGETTDNMFEFFNRQLNNKVLKLSSIIPFGHESYTSVYHLRYFLDSELEQLDKDILKSQWNLYKIHLNLYEDFLNHITNNGNVIEWKMDVNFKKH